MKTMTITEFKAHALQSFKRVREHKETILVTKWGQPIAEVMPYTSETADPGKLSGTLTFEKDIVSPLGGAMWKAGK